MEQKPPFFFYLCFVKKNVQFMELKKKNDTRFVLLSIDDHYASVLAYIYIYRILMKFPL